MKKLMLGLLMAAGILSACANEPEKTVSKEELPFLEVDLQIDPEQAEMGEEVIFTAHVTYDGKPVTDADEVEFEIWRSQSETHEKREVSHKKDGIYELGMDFTEEGTYYVYAHVTAKDMHNMPKKEFVIGKPSEPETDQEPNMDMDMENKEEGKEHSSH